MYYPVASCIVCLLICACSQAKEPSPDKVDSLRLAAAARQMELLSTSSGSTSLFLINSFSGSFVYGGVLWVNFKELLIEIYFVHLFVDAEQNWEPYGISALTKCMDHVLTELSISVVLVVKNSKHHPVVSWWLFEIRAQLHWDIILPQHKIFVTERLRRQGKEEKPKKGNIQWLAHSL